MTKLLGLVLGIALVLPAAPASANPPGETPPADEAPADDTFAPPAADYYGGDYTDRGGQRARMRAIRKRIKAQFDADGDGRLSREERRTARAAVGMRFAHNKQRKHKLEMVRKVIRKFDRDGDGVVGPGEAPPRVVRKLKKLDRNHDGWINDADFARRGRGDR
jgi:hypothetical protein